MGPDEFPAEFYKHCPALREILEGMHNGMLAYNHIPELLRRFYVAPLDKPGKDPTECSNRRPIAVLRPLMKLLELALARRMLPGLEGKLSEGQYAYQ